MSSTFNFISDESEMISLNMLLRNLQDYNDPNNFDENEWDLIEEEKDYQKAEEIAQEIVKKDEEIYGEKQPDPKVVLQVDINDKPQQDRDTLPPPSPALPPSHFSAFHKFIHHPVITSDDYLLEVWEVLFLTALLYAIIKIFHYVYRSIMCSFQAKVGLQVLTMRNECKYNFKKELQGLRPEQILGMSCTELKNGLINREFTSVDLVNLYAHRCYRVGRSLSLTSHENFYEALKLAAQRDHEREMALRTGEIDRLGLLHGIPISVQEFIGQKGQLSTNGMTYRCKKVEEEDSAVLKQYLYHGAIPLVKGNMAQGGFGLHTKNLIFGEAINPIDFSRSCGGNSGGDAALVAAKCVPLAIGSDFDGSLRVPAAFCGVTCMKPTHGRFTNKGANPVSQFTHIEPTVGPLCQTVDDCILAFKVQVDPHANKLDPMQRPSYWNHDMFLDATDKELVGNMKIGFLQESPMMPVSESVKRAMMETESALRKAGYKVVPFFLTDEVWNQGRDYLQAMIANGIAPSLFHEMYNEFENYNDQISMMDTWLSSCSVFRWILEAIQSNLFDRTRHVVNFQKFRKMSPQQFESLLKRRNDFVNQVSKKWQRSGLTALISPVYPHCAFKSQYASSLRNMNEYTHLWSVLGFPCGVVPVTKVKSFEENYRDIYDDQWSYYLNKSAQGSANLPICLQVVGHAQEDEKVLGIMKVIEEAMDFRIEYPRISTQEPNYLEALRKTIVTNDNSKPGQQQRLTINHDNGERQIAVEKASGSGSHKSEIVSISVKQSVRQSQRQSLNVHSVKGSMRASQHQSIHGSQRTSQRKSMFSSSQMRRAAEGAVELVEENSGVQLDQMAMDGAISEAPIEESVAPADMNLNI